MVVYHAYIHMGRDEWGNELMRKVADAYADKHADNRPLIVSVHEHADWHLSFLYGAPGISNGSAEQRTATPCWRGGVVEFGKGIHDTEKVLETIRRP